MWHVDAALAQLRASGLEHQHLGDVDGSEPAADDEGVVQELEGLWPA